MSTTCERGRRQLLLLRRTLSSSPSSSSADLPEEGEPTPTTPTTTKPATLHLQPPHPSSQALKRSPLAHTVSYGGSNSQTFRTAKSLDQTTTSNAAGGGAGGGASGIDARKLYLAARSKSLNVPPPATAASKDGTPAVSPAVSGGGAEERVSPCPSQPALDQGGGGGEVVKVSGQVWESLRSAATSSSSGGGVDAAAATTGGTAVGFSWSFLLSLHQLIMMSNLQTMIFGSSSRSCQRPSLQPNEYMDSVIETMKESMKERGLEKLDLPDQDVGVVVLYDGHLSGLTNLCRRGDALLVAETDHLLLTFAVQAKDLRCAYWWRKRRLKGEVCAVVQRIVLNVQLKQMMPAKTPPKLMDFKVDEVADVQVILHGLGPLNWVVRRALRAFLRRHLKGYLEREGRDIIEQELRNINITLGEEQPSYLSTFLG